MPARLRKLVGLFAIVGFLGLYVVLAVMIGERMPEHWVARTAYFAFAGVLWGVPLFPLIRWMSAGK